MTLLHDRRGHRLLILVGALLLALLLLGQPGTSAVANDRSGATHGRGHGPDDGSAPLPGYTITNPPLAPATAGGQPTTVFQGTDQHAGYVVEKPQRWNGELVMWAHGYRGTGKVLYIDAPAYGLRQKMLDQGYAWAASSYARNDYDVASGVATTQGLAVLSQQLLGKRPARTYIMGVSMGGHIIGRSLEQYPNFYAGAMPMCGVLGDQELFDYFLDYNLVAQDLADIPAYPPPADYLTNAAPRIDAALGLDTVTPATPAARGNALGEELRAITTERTGGPRPGADAGFAVFQDFLYSLFTPDNGGRLAQNAGRLSQNLHTYYTPTAPVDVNGTVRRVTPQDPQSRGARRLIDIPTIEGTPKVPVLTLHGLGDLFVPFSMEQIYARDVARHRQSRYLVQRAIRSVQHCDFTPTEAGTAWDDLTTWVESQRGPGGRGRAGSRPAGDDVLTRSVVASPTYGCTFSDPDRGAGQPTRFYIPACPAP